MAAFENILLEERDAVALIRLNRPKVLNALSGATVNEIASALEGIAGNDALRCVVLTGSERAFAAGADISEMAGGAPPSSGVDHWARLTRFSKPVIAAVNGLALGGGMELAMLCDIVLAGENARFGQPEINLGIIPGAGGTQRLTRAVGKSLAMEMVLNARMLNAEEALRVGLVSGVYPSETLLYNALTLAKQIAARAPLAIRAAKASVNAAFETSLEAGLTAEREQFTKLFGTEDQQEGMNAFLEKRRAQWKGK
ncbi:MAG: enoyl-CoA hydratase [Pleurocapsa sp. SU_196_0]|nr:enoyl-CoA hydratase [Pleurocapsa sp. SU_196_0]